MSQRGLEALLKPKTIAVIGASQKEHRAGHLMMKNLLSGQFSGSILPVTPKYAAVCGVMAWPDVASLPTVPDLAVICTNATRHYEILEALGKKGCKACIILSSPHDSLDKLKAWAAQWNIRLLGPNSLGIIAPWQGLNASFSPVPSSKGRLAFISQSAAVSNTILDWAQQRQLGFSWFIAMGEAIDIDLDDLLDFLSRDSKTSAILISIENIRDARRFVSAARSASRLKPVLLIKSGRSLSARQLLNQTASFDGTWDAAIQRAGMLRVQDTHELFSAVETLSHMRPLRGEKLFIISNGIAPAALAVDELDSRNGVLASLSEQTREKLAALLPASFTLTNPLDLRDDATTERYLQVLQVLMDAQELDAVLVIHAPSAVSPATESAEKIAALANAHPRNKQIALLTNWGGEHSSQQARMTFSQAGIPTWRTPEGAVTAFMHMVEYHRNQRQLRETPARSAELPTARANARQQLQRALKQATRWLNTPELVTFFACYGVKMLPSWLAETSQQAVTTANNIGYPVAVKLYAHEISHKSEIQGVRLYLQNAQEVEQATNSILERAHQVWPQAKIYGVLVQSMAQRAGGEEVRIVVQHDPLFGPVILLGEENDQWLEDQQAAVGLPPLNMALASHLIQKAIKQKKIRPRHLQTSQNQQALCELLVKTSEMIIECPEIASLEMSALIDNQSNAILLDVGMSLQTYDNDRESEDRLAIRPYPQRFEQKIELKNGEDCLLRPILPEDEPQLRIFIDQVTKEDLYYRYFSEINEFTHDDLANMTQIDYDREMAFVAERTDQGSKEIIGVSRAISDADNIDAEFSVLVRSDLKGIGLGGNLMNKLILYTRDHGIQHLRGITMPHNRNMIALAKKLGFTTQTHLEDGIVSLDLKLSKDEG